MSTKIRHDDIHEIREEKLEDILRSIRGIVDNQSRRNVHSESYHSHPEPQRCHPGLDAGSHERARFSPEIPHQARDDIFGVQDDTLGTQDDDAEDEPILELTTEYNDGKVYQSHNIVSNETANKCSAIIRNFTKSVDTKPHHVPENKTEAMINDLIKPILKEWLDNNLPQLVEKIVTHELQKFVPKA